MPSLCRSLVSSLVLATLFIGNSFAGQRSAQQPDLLILQGPGSDIQITVAAVAVNQRPGVIVEQVTRGGPADSAGVRRGDIVTEFDAIAITDPAHFRRVVRDTAPGRRVKAIVWRDGNRREVFIVPTTAKAP